MSAQPFDPIADLHMAVEQIKRELTLERFRRVMHWRNRKRGKRRAYFAMKSGCALVAPGVPRGRALGTRNFKKVCVVRSPNGF